MNNKRVRVRKLVKCGILCANANKSLYILFHEAHATIASAVASVTGSATISTMLASVRSVVTISGIAASTTAAPSVVISS